MTETPIYDNKGNLIGYMGSYLPVFGTRGCVVGHMIGTRNLDGDMFPAIIRGE